MATKTPNLNLVKPEMGDYANINDLNGNMDILDKEVQALKNKDYPYVKLSGQSVTSNLSINNTTGNNICLQCGDNRFYVTNNNDPNPNRLVYTVGNNNIKFHAGEGTIVFNDEGTRTNAWSIQNGDYRLNFNRNTKELACLRGGSTWSAVEIVENSYSTAVRYSSGVQICYINTTSNGFTWTFPVPFSNTDYAVTTGAMSWNRWADVGIKLTSYSNTALSVAISHGESDPSSGSARVGLIVIGRWK